MISTIFVMIALVVLSAYFSATETAFSSINKTRLLAMQEKGNKRAEKVLKISEDYNKLLSTILIGNNIVNIALASIGTVFFVKHLGDVGATVSTVVITVIVLVFGEISPKSIAKDNPESFAMSTASLLSFFIILLTPLNFVFSLWKKLLLKIFKQNENAKLTQDELMVLVSQAADDGELNETETELLKSVLEFDDTDAENILIPRIDIEAVNIEDSKEQIARVFTDTMYSRLPVYEENIDKIVGVIHQKDFYIGMSVTEKSIKEIMTPPVFVPKSIKISSLLKLLQKNKSHVAIISDDYGGTLGMVTMEDILEELVGEIWDEHDEVVETFKKTGENTYRVVCAEDIQSLYEFFDIQGDDEISTIGGWVMQNLGKIPVEGDRFTFENLDVLVTDTDDRRVIEIEIKVN